MKKLLNTLLLTVFFALCSVSGFLLPVYSYEVAPISGADTSADTVIADSQNDCSGVQGQDSWFYGYYTNCGNSSSFTQMTYDTNGWWEETETQPPWTLLRYNGGNPSSNHCAVRRWVSEVSGDIVITGRVNKNDTSVGGDGITASILVDGVIVWSQDIAYNDSTGVSYEVNATVNVDSIVDFVISPGNNGSEAYDTSDFTATISGSGESSLEVNVTGDEPDAALTDGVCDVDLSTDGNQCTLRAAIQEANKREGEDTITFDSSVSAITASGGTDGGGGVWSSNGSVNAAYVEIKDNEGPGVAAKNNIALESFTISGNKGPGIQSLSGGISIYGSSDHSEDNQVTENQGPGIMTGTNMELKAIGSGKSKSKGSITIQTDVNVSNNAGWGIIAPGGDVAVNRVDATGDWGAVSSSTSVISGNGNTTLECYTLNDKGKLVLISSEALESAGAGGIGAGGNMAGAILEGTGNNGPGIAANEKVNLKQLRR